MPIGYGFAWFSGRSVPYIFLRNSVVSSPDAALVLAHEVGHYFGLFHTFGTTNEGCFASGEECECPDGSNCDSTGDWLCDTPADPELGWGDISDPPDCNYIGTQQPPNDCNGTPYAPPVRNVMAYGRRPCLTEFTPMQIAKMWYTLQNGYACGLTGPRKRLVPQDYATIQDAIVAANPCDTVWILPGTYSGSENVNLNFHGKKLSVIGAEGAEQTVIDCQGLAPAFTFDNMESRESLLRGITIVDGSGGGVVIGHSSPTIDSCIFESCSRAVWMENVDDSAVVRPLLSSNIFRECIYLTGSGGAVYVDKNCNPDMIGNVFVNNFALQAGAVYVAPFCAGGYFFNNIFDGNRALGFAGGAVLIEQIAGATEFIQNTFVNNICGGPSGVGNAVLTLRSQGEHPHVVLKGLNITNNGAYGISFEEWVGTADIECCNFWQNSPGNVNPGSALQPSIPSGTLLSVDPQYCDLDDGNYNLSWLSPCAQRNSEANGCLTTIGALDIGCGPASMLLSPLNGQVTTAQFLDWEDLEGGAHDYFTYLVEVDNNSELSSVERSLITDLSSWSVSPGLPDGTWYWRVRGRYHPTLDPEVGIWGDWSETRSFQKVTDGGGFLPSCPVLFVQTSEGLIEENPLLTACERTGYTAEVVDYYKIRTDIPANSEKLTLQVYELEKEVTYLRSLNLITVDHPPHTMVASDVEGRVMLCDLPGIPPTSAVDSEGRDRLSEVADEDGITFQATSSGSLTLTYPKRQGAMSIRSASKGQCYLDKSASEPRRSKPEITVDFREPDGLWAQKQSLPPREQDDLQFVFPEVSNDSNGYFTARITWIGPYEVDYLPFYSSVLEEPVINELKPSATVLLPTASRTSLAPPDDALVVLREGDAIAFEFHLPSRLIPGDERDYIVKSTGRYEPDPEVRPDHERAGMRLHGSFPNPFNSGTTISFELSQRSNIRLEVFNILGSRIRVLLSGLQEAGMTQVNWDGRDDAGNELPSGVYLYRLEADSYQSTRKIILLK